jgi:very-short-patch-repair endonuclease
VTAGVATARALRRRCTLAEARLWRHLRNRGVAGAKVRRQHRIGPYVVDFACVDAGLVVEVDGGQHADRQAEDARRTAFLERHGFRVVRYWNTDVLINLEGVLADLARHLATRR